MLARSYLTAQELGVPEILRDALITLAGMIERGELVHGSLWGVTHLIPVSAHDHYGSQPILNMRDWANDAYSGVSTYCGTVMCIGGACEWIMREDLDDLDLVVGWDWKQTRLNELFHPLNDPARWSNITAEQMRDAIICYLSTGKPAWEEILA